MLVSAVWLTDAWVADPLAVGVVGLLVLLLRARGVGRRRWRRRDRWLVAGAAVLVLAVVSPVAGLSGELFTAHMAQHLLLTVVAAPMLAAGDPGPAALAASPPRVRGRLVAAWSRLPDSLRSPGAGVVAGAVSHAVVFWVWHLPVLYSAAIDRPALHLLEHVTLVGTAVVFWGATVRRRGRHRQLLAVTVLASAALVLQSGVLAALLTFSTTHWYPVYDMTSIWGLTGLADQRLAGTVLWVSGAPAYAVAAVAAVIRGLEASGDLQPAASVTARSGAPPAPPDRGWPGRARPPGSPSRPPDDP